MIPESRRDCPQSPTRVRFLVLAATSLVASNMYLDRACLSQVADLVKVDLNLQDWQKDWMLGAFFWAYALAQVPAGWLGTRFGFRLTLTLYLVLWSVFTAVTGLTTGFFTLMAARLAVGLAEAGAYPSAASIVRAWFPLPERGRASSAVTLGGRLGWALSQLLTPALVLALANPFLAGWRVTLILYGTFGLFAAIVFWIVARDTPAKHPWSNEADVVLAGPPPPAGATKGIPWRLLARSRNMWLAGGTQCGANIGWAFLLTQLPVFLTEARGVSIEERGVMASVPAWMSCVGMFLGGFLTDGLTRRLGIRWGRALPIGTMMSVSGVAYLVCTQVRDPWVFVGVLACMGMAVDMANPAQWALYQDLGGRHVAAALGWGNMWGNLGAAVSPILIGAVQRQYGWDAAFLACAAAFAVSGVCGFLTDATKPLQTT